MSIARPVDGGVDPLGPPASATLSPVASATHLHLQVAPAAASVAVAVEAAVSDVIRYPCHFSIAFVFAYNRE
jgi:hypothetical protein